MGNRVFRHGFLEEFIDVFLFSQREDFLGVQAKEREDSSEERFESLEHEEV